MATEKSCISNLMGNENCNMKATTNQSYRSRLLGTHCSELVETACSPAKYAIFSAMGSWLISWATTNFSAIPQLRFFPASSSSIDTALSAKVGCIGGTFLSFFYLILLMTRAKAHDTPDTTESSTTEPAAFDSTIDADLFSFKRSAAVVLNEMFYSTVAAGIGAGVYLMTSSPPPVDPLAEMVYGGLGPLLLVVGCGSLVGAVYGICRAYSKTLDWWAGY